jgi:hypothetical protein
MAGRNIERVEAQRAALGITARVVEADAADVGQVEAAAAGCDVVLNLAGADEVTPASAAEGALRAGCHYVDIGASPRSLQDLLARSSAFEARGLTCVPSIGTAPGLLGMLGCHAASHLDSCESVTVHLGAPLARWGDPGDVAASHREGGPVLQSHAAIVGWFTRPAPVVREGRLAWVRPSDNATVATAPDGRSFPMMPIASTEAVTVPLAVPDVVRVETLGALWPEAVMDLVAARAPDEDLEEATRLVFAELATWDASQLLPAPDYPTTVLWGQADGRRDGRAASVRCTNTVASTTAGIAATAVLLVGIDASLPRGVHPPEVCFDLIAFLGEVAATQHVAVSAEPVTTAITR